ncbi:MAG: YbaB/EbfC family nucleoid-associated protein [Desulfatiglandales bacterium]
MKGFGNVGQLMKQAQELQAKIQKLQEELGEKQVTGSAGGGMVTVVANGRQEIISISIEKEVINPEDQEMLQDLIVAAVNDAISKSKAMVNEGMSSITRGLSIPGLGGLL